MKYEIRYKWLPILQLSGQFAKILDISGINLVFGIMTQNPAAPRGV
jgi:hypothetical protein